MVKSLPTNPSLDYLKREAKKLQKSFKQHDPNACIILRNLHALEKKSDEEIFATDLPLSQIQYAIAMEYGFKSWRALKSHLEVKDQQPETDEDDKLLLIEFESLQQMNWHLNIQLEKCSVVEIVTKGEDRGNDVDCQISDDGKIITLDTDTSWSHGAIIFELSSNQGTFDIEISDPYVGDRLQERSFSVSEFRSRKTEIKIKSNEWPIIGCFARITTVSNHVQKELDVLSSLTSDRGECIDRILRFADSTSDKEFRKQLLFRAAAACSGGCNHGPLDPNGWDKAIEIYKRIISEYPGTEDAVNAEWALASCYASWSPIAGCDDLGLGKGDWETSLNAYTKLYENSSLPGDKVEALRRMAEIKCMYSPEANDGLRIYRLLMDEFPDGPPSSPHWSFRTCAPQPGTKGIAHDVWEAISKNSGNNEDAQKLAEEFFADSPLAYALELAKSVEGISLVNYKEAASLHGNHLYAVVEEVCSWHTAKLRCELLGGKLACIENPETNSFLAELVSVPSYSAWIGASYENSSLKWINGSPVEYSNLKKEAKNDGAIVLFGNSSWQEINSDDGRWYICQWDK